MKYSILILLLSVLLICDSLAAENKPRKHKKYRTKKVSDNSDATSSSETNEKSAPPMAAGLEMLTDDTALPIVDPCINVHCGAGRVCQLDDVGEPQCVCISECPEETESRRKVCSNHNETWSSDCALYRRRCICERGDKECRGENDKHVHIEYYGECRHMQKCKKEEMADFPRRMRDWLFNVMRDLADRRELSNHFMKMEREAESNMTKRWMNAAIWKFCDLDGHPPDRSISRHELFPIRAPLMALEHCIAPFLNDCDKDDDHRITIKEWAKCLELEEDEIEDRCEEIGEELEDE